MKYTHYNHTISIFCFALLGVLASCRKESDTVTLGAKIDDYIGAPKLYIDSNIPQWEEGDPVWINGNGDYSISFNGTVAQITNILRDNDNHYTAVYPADIVTDQGVDGSVSINLSREQVFQWDNTNSRQQINVPMIAYTANGRDLCFKNLCSLVKVIIFNNTTSEISLKRITLTASSAMLSGPTTASIVTVQGAKQGQLGTWGSDAEHDVSLVFNTPFSISSNSQSEFYICVPEFSSTELSIIVYTSDNCIFPVLKSSVSLDHNAIAAVNLNIGQLMAVHEGFTVDGNGTQVRFSKGNLQYSRQDTHNTADGNNTDGTWRFAKHQYDVIGVDNNQISNTNYTGWIDLFGWATSGYNGFSPTLFSTENNAYFNKNNDITLTTTANYDWGIYNMIDGYPAATWRTPTSDEWDYILDGRTGVTIGSVSNIKFAEVQVNQIKGIILFPDEFEWPLIITNPITIYNNVHAGWNNSAFSLAQWSILESTGAVFLPAAGKRTGNSTDENNMTGYYWTSSKLGAATWDKYYALAVLFNTSSVNFGHQYFARSQGNSVRLVKTIQ